jgi:hypothetical protein
MRDVRSARLSLGIVVVTVALTVGVMAPPASAVGVARHGAPAHTSAKLASVVRADRHGVTYRLPSGRLLTLGRGRPHVEGEPGSVDFTSTGVVTTGAGVDYRLVVDANSLGGGDGFERSW